MLRRAPVLFVALLLAALTLASAAARRGDTLPASLSDRDFWSLVTRISEPDGYFVSRSGSPDNLLSNEMQISSVAAEAAGQIAGDGVYLGVGPEQNFTYIAAIKPRIAFITDIRRGNLDLHLVYKALFETSATRAEFVAKLFGRTPVTALPKAATAAQLMAAYARAATVPDAVFAATMKEAVDLLTAKHGFALTPADRTNIDHAWRAFYRFGPAIDYTSSINGRSRRFASYADIMGSVDFRGIERGFLANDDNFALIKSMESKNLIVPVVGDFAGPKALRAIGAWVKAHGATVSAFYVSNVEQYLQQNGVWNAFCANAASLPIDRTSVFIRPSRGGSSFSPMASETASCASR